MVNDTPIAFLFPGQGAQKPGMLESLHDDSIGAATYREAQSILRRDLVEIDTAEALAGTEATQLALLIAGVAGSRRLEKNGVAADFVAGHSIGAFAAAVHADVIGFAEALALVDVRGRAMANAQPSGFGMAAIVGVPERIVQDWIDSMVARGATLYLANRNAPRQFAVSGAATDLDALIDYARTHGASKAVRLAVAVPSHCPLMEPVVPKLREALTRMTLHELRVPYASNHTARLLRDAAGVADDLAENAALPVRWNEIMIALYERGVRNFIEMRPGDVLTKIAQSSFDGVRAFALEATDITTLRDFLSRREE